MGDSIPKALTGFYGYYSKTQHSERQIEKENEVWRDIHLG